MDKLFLDVFPALQLNSKLQNLFSEVFVTRVGTNKQKNSIRIYISSEHLILKEYIYAMEKEIKNQLFPKHNMMIKIYEKYTLSAQYNIKTLLEIYLESMLDEIQRYSQILYSALRKAEFIPGEETLLIKVEDYVPYRNSETEIKSVFEKIIVERCGISCRILVEYKDAEKTTFKEETEILLQREVESIVRRAGLNQTVDAATVNEEINTSEGAPSFVEDGVEAKKMIPTEEVKKAFGDGTKNFEKQEKNT